MKKERKRAEKGSPIEEVLRKRGEDERKELTLSWARSRARESPKEDVIHLNHGEKKGEWGHGIIDGFCIH